MVRVNALSAAAVATLGGGALAAGLLCLLAMLPRWAAVPLVLRIAAFVRDVVDDDDIPRSVLPRVGPMPAGRPAIWTRLVTALERMRGDSEDLSRRLAQAGTAMEPSTFRGRQLGWSLAGLGVGAIAVIGLALADRMTGAAALIPVLTTAVGALGYGMRLSARTRARRARLTDELPTTLEFLALCLSAGESLLDSLRRVAGIGSGELTEELRRVVLAVGTGSPLADALRDMTGRLQLAGLTRAIDQVVAALEHGAPLAGVLHAQASDAREDAKRVLIEQAGRKEILMLLPLVSLILPLSVLFAIYPGLFILRLGIG